MVTVSITTVQQARQHFLIKKGLKVFRAEAFYHPMGEAYVLCFYIFLPSDSEVIAFIVRTDGFIYVPQDFWSQFPVVE